MSKGNVIFACGGKDQPENYSALLSKIIQIFINLTFLLEMIASSHRKHAFYISLGQWRMKISIVRYEKLNRKWNIPNAPSAMCRENRQMLNYCWIWKHENCMCFKMESGRDNIESWICGFFLFNNWQNSWSSGFCWHFFFAADGSAYLSYETEKLFIKIALNVSFLHCVSLGIWNTKMCEIKDTMHGF